MKKSTKEDTNRQLTTQGLDHRTFAAAVIGVSAGGFDALHTLLPLLSKDLALAVIIVQHTHAHSNGIWIHNLNERCQITLKQADEKEQITPGVVYLAPPNYHLLVEDDKTFSLSVAAKVNYARPSIDVLFETAAEVYGSHLIGIILTGANNDGSRGLRTIKDRGGLTVVQDPDTAEVDTMPRAAMELSTVDYVLSLQEIGALLNTISEMMS